MKRMVIVISIIVFLLVINNTTEDLVIPSEAIRIRVIANSNNPQDQLLKKQIRDSVQTEVTNLLEEIETVDEARKTIKDNLDRLEKAVNETVGQSQVSYEIDYGYNLFPEKKYKGVVYEEGYYESIVVTVGEGKGDNWWCVLFPPLCLMEADESDMEEVEYKSFFKEIIDKYF